MPWSRVEDLPAAVRQRYPSEPCLRAFRQAANAVIARQGEAAGMAAGHAAARRCMEARGMSERIHDAAKSRKP